MSFRVAAPGLCSLLVDGGRTGARVLGVPTGGAADRAAWRLANQLLGNPPDAVALELALAGPTLEATTDTACAVVGAPFELRVDGRPVEAGGAFTVRAGATLAIGGTPSGVRAYLAVGGGFDAPLVLGSRSALDAIGRGDVLECPESRTPGRALPAATVAELLAEAPVLHAVAGPQRDWFTDDAFFTRPWVVLPASNRMGVRLGGEALAKRAGELASEPVAPGAVQVAHNGRPIVLGVDGQTIGGYPKVAHVVRADLDKLAQLRPGGAVRFACVTLAEAEVLARDRAAKLRGWAVRLAGQFG